MTDVARRRSLLALTAIAAGVCVAARVHDVDAPWHVATGRWILEHSALPHRDPFSFTFHGAPWQNHSPLAQVTLALAHAAGGWAGVVVWQIVLTGALAFVGVASAARRGARVELAAPIALVALVTELAALAPRPGLMAAVLIAIAIDLLLDVGRDPASRRVWALPIVYAVAIPTHATHALVPVLAAALLVAWMLLGDRARARRLLAPTAICVVLFAIFGRDAVELALAHSGGFMEGAIGEWASVSIVDLLGSVDGALLALVLAITGAGALMRLARFRDNERAVLLESALALVGVALSVLSSYRALSLFVLAGLPLWLPSAAHALEPIASRVAPRARLGASIAIVIALVAWRGGGRPILTPGLGLDETRFPVTAVRAMRDAGATRRVYNAFNFGGYLAYEGIPVFVDGRAVTLYPEEFLERFAAAYTSDAMFEELARRYEVETVLLPAISQRARPLIERLEHDPRWRLLHRDAVAVVFVRRSAPASDPR